MKPMVCIRVIAWTFVVGLLLSLMYTGQQFWGMGISLVDVFVQMTLSGLLFMPIWAVPMMFVLLLFGPSASQGRIACLCGGIVNWSVGTGLFQLFVALFGSNAIRLGSDSTKVAWITTFALCFVCGATTALVLVCIERLPSLARKANA